MPAKPFGISCKAMIQDGRGRCLVVRRSTTSGTDPGCWEFPGGKANAGEDLTQALLREVVEETGLEVEVTGVAGLHEADMAGFHVAFYVFDARTERTDVRLSTEHEDFAWTETEALATLDLCPQIAQFLRNRSNGSSSDSGTGSGSTAADIRPDRLS